MLSALGKCKILFSGTFAVSSWQLKSIAVAPKQLIHVFQLFSCFVQKRRCPADNVCLQVRRLHQVSESLCLYLLLPYHHHRIFLRWRSMVIFVILLVSRRYSFTSISISAEMRLRKKPVYLHRTELSRKPGSPIKYCRYDSCGDLFHKLTVGKSELGLDDQGS